MSSVYFIQAGPGGPIKIGRAKNVEQRISMLQTGQAQKLTLLGTLPGAAKEERDLHDKLAAHRVSGEWFAPHPDVLACIDQPRGEPKAELFAFMCEIGDAVRPVISVAGFKTPAQLNAFIAGLEMRGVRFIDATTRPIADLGFADSYSGEKPGARDDVVQERINRAEAHNRGVRHGTQSKD